MWKEGFCQRKFPTNSAVPQQTAAQRDRFINIVLKQFW